MKSLLALAVLVSFAASANPFDKPTAVGTVQVKDYRESERLSIELKGDVAQYLFDKLSVRGMYGVDASERRDGRRLVVKEGRDYSCSLKMGASDNKASCVLDLAPKGQGTVIPRNATGTLGRADMGVITSSGKLSVYNILGARIAGQNAVLSIEGLAAERIYNALSVRVERTDAVNQLNGDTVDSKNGSNVSCSKRTKRGTPVRYDCGLTIESKAGGKITAPGVG